MKYITEIMLIIVREKWKRLFDFPWTYTVFFPFQIWTVDNAMNNGFNTEDFI